VLRFLLLDDDADDASEVAVSALESAVAPQLWIEYVSKSSVR